MIAGTKTTRDVILAHFGETLLKEHQALVLASDIFDQPDIKCVSIVFPEIGKGPGQGRYLAHQFEDGYCERVFPVPEYTVVGVMPIRTANALMNRSSDQKKVKPAEGGADV